MSKHEKGALEASPDPRQMLQKARTHARTYIHTEKITAIQNKRTKNCQSTDYVNLWLKLCQNKNLMPRNV